MLPCTSLQEDYGSVGVGGLGETTETKNILRNVQASKLVHAANAVGKRSSETVILKITAIRTRVSKLGWKCEEMSNMLPEAETEP